jgi:hypothetical protein
MLRRFKVYNALVTVYNNKEITTISIRAIIFNVYLSKII